MDDFKVGIFKRIFDVEFNYESIDVLFASRRDMLFSFIKRTKKVSRIASLGRLPAGAIK